MIAFIKKIIYTSLSLFILIYFLSTTHFGLQIIFKCVTALIPGQISVAQLNGALVSHVYIRNLRYQSYGKVITVNTVYLKWSPAQLLKRKLSIDQLLLDEATIRLAESKEQQHSNFDMRQLNGLQHLVLRFLSIQNLFIIKNNKTVLNIHALEIKQQADNFYAIAANSSQGNIDGIYRIDWGNNLAWQTKLNMQQLDLQILLNDKLSNISAKITSNGMWNATNHVMQVNIQNVSGNLDQYPLRGNVTINYDNGKIQIKNAELLLADAFVKLSGTLDQYCNLLWKFNIPSLQTVNPILHGQIYGKGSVTGLRNNFNILADLQANKIVAPHVNINQLSANISSKQAGAITYSNLLIKNLNSDGTIIPTLKLNLMSRLDKNNLVSQLNLALDQKNKINGDIQLDDIKHLNADTLVKANLTLLFEDLNKLIITPYVKRLQGTLRAEIQLSGKINKPSYYVKAQINQAQLFVPDINRKIENINLTANYQTTQPIIFQATFNAGEGKGSLNGKFDPAMKELPLAIHLTGSDLQILNLPEYKIEASPDLFILVDRQNTFIKGDLTNVSSQIKPKDFSSVTTLPKETTIVGETPPENNPFNELSLQINIVLGDNNFISYENLQAKLTGKLSIAQKKGQMATANGELYTIQGNYRAYGNSLKITKGKLIYAGNLLADPGLNIKASKNIESSAFAQDQSQFAADHKIDSIYQGVKRFTVGVEVLGTLNKPQVSFYSDIPGMSQNDILSYLLFGYPQSGIKNLKGVELLNKVAAGVNNGSNKVDQLTNKIQSTLGLDNLSLGSIQSYDLNTNTTQSVSAVNIEKKLSKKLSIKYRVGIFNALSVLNIKYKINKLFAVQSESSTQDNGVDLLFEYEHD